MHKADHHSLILEKKKVLILKLHILIYLPVSSTIKTHIFLTKIAVSIDSILIMLLLEISGEHVLLMLFSFPQFRLSCKGDNKFTDFGKASEPVKSKFI